jgi:hypothetical protein
METPAKQIHHQYTAEERTQWVSRFRSSGLTQVQFAQENGLKQKTLQRWLYGRKSRRVLKRRLARGLVDKSGAGRSHGTAAVLRGKPRRLSAAAFREVRVQPLWAAPAWPGWAAELSWPSGVTVRLQAGVEASWMEALLEAVRRAC